MWKLNVNAAQEEKSWRRLHVYLLDLMSGAIRIFSLWLYDYIGQTDL